MLFLHRNVSRCFQHSDIVKEGTLSKEGEVNSAWQQRHFVLGRDKEMKYYKGVALKGSIHVENATILMDTGKQKNNSFGIQTPTRTYYLSAPTTAEMQDWVDKLIQEGGAVLPTEQIQRRGVCTLSISTKTFLTLISSFFSFSLFRPLVRTLCSKAISSKREGKANQFGNRDISCSRM